MTWHVRLGLFGLVMGVLLMMSCEPPATAPEIEPLSAKAGAWTFDVAAQPQDSQVQLRLTLRAGTDDGKGSLLGYEVTASGGTPWRTVTATFGGAVAVLPVTLGPYRYLTSQSGTVCARVLRNRTNSSILCKPWTAVLGDISPPPPIVGQ